MDDWLVYVLLSADEHRTYVGITNDLSRRVDQHNGDLPGGAKATRSGRPWTIGQTYGPYETRSEAQRVEYEVKRRRGFARVELD
jgi:predicted GIY-YIG superfamily endonuclease